VGDCFDGEQGAVAPEIRGVPRCQMADSMGYHPCNNIAVVDLFTKHTELLHQSAPERLQRLSSPYNCTRASSPPIHAVPPVSFGMLNLAAVRGALRRAASARTFARQLGELLGKVVEVFPAPGGHR
jgi:hypothetical protein